ncbi:AAA family ATPase [Terriglobus albidus]|uniref:AAA family ATPase n=1 Tax=Terriglobus albidus TaxID=1592106 RepID=UPI0021E05DB7|nr:AAA family ATPase [Terriglobus albidus]
MTSVALIFPQMLQRQLVADALTGLWGYTTHEFGFYPDLGDKSSPLDGHYGVVIVELDSDPEYALELVEAICANSTSTVMVYSSQVQPEMLVRCMRAGAREFLTPPITSNVIAEALVRATARNSASRSVSKAAGKSIIFIGAKGGSGVTTVASNFAVALAQDCAESNQSVLLIDLTLPLGDVALELGITPQYSTADALEEPHRLDCNFLSRLLSKHKSGLSVLAAPDKYVEIAPSNKAIEQLLSVARQNFDYVVVDAGSHLGTTGQALFDDGATVYLVTQVGIPDLRNSNRIVSELQSKSGTKVQVVLNRYTPRSLVIDEENITKALTMPARWKIPNDESSARNAQNTAVPLVLKDSPASRVIWDMVRESHGTAEKTEKKKRFSLFG